ncbi:MAG: hypothetical protein ACRYG8_15600 [Janthinobacterium lividum]
MNVAGYETGPIACQAAFIADFDVAADIPLSHLVSKVDTDRRRMDVRRGMHSKYVPLRFDPATGAHQIGGRYLFETWDDVLDYMKFTSEELEFEPGTKFWNRPFFSNIDKRAWHVVGAHDFMPLATHYVSRFERFAYEAETTVTALEATWPAIRNAAQEEGRASVWLLNQPDEQQISILTVATQLSAGNQAERASRSLTALEHAESLASRVSSQIAVRSLFDRTSLNLSLWLPRSQRAGGDPSIFPTFPVHPLPQSGS